VATHTAARNVLVIAAILSDPIIAERSRRRLPEAICAKNCHRARRRSGPIADAG
jgi:hypothetical protein